ncbi:MAG: SPOR domain-containing protein [Gemmatimonadaceae bacterium]
MNYSLSNILHNIPNNIALNPFSNRSTNVPKRVADCVATVVAAISVLTFSPMRARAQGATSVSPAVTTATARARSLADAGNGAKARELLDSLVNALPRESLEEAEALYWRALLAEQSADAERDWKRLIVDVPFSPRAAEGLLRLSELDLARNDTQLAYQRVQRLLSDHPDAPERPRAMLLLARLYFTGNDSPRACGVLSVVRREAPLSAVEVRLQADELQQQCRKVHEIAMGAAPDSLTPISPTVAPPVTAVVTPPVASTAKLPVTTKTPTVVAPVTPPATVKPPVTTQTPPATAATILPPTTSSATTAVTPPPVANVPPISNQGDTAIFKVEPHPSKPAVVEKSRAVGKWTVQIAAYETRAQAEALVKRLSAKKIDAHSAGSKKPFRVQVGRYVTRAQATNALATLKKNGQKGFVTEVGTP